MSYSASAEKYKEYCEHELEVAEKEAEKDSIKEYKNALAEVNELFSAKRIQWVQQQLNELHELEKIADEDADPCEYKHIEDIDERQRLIDYDVDEESELREGILRLQLQ